MPEKLDSSRVPKVMEAQRCLAGREDLDLIPDSGPMQCARKVARVHRAPGLASEQAVTPRGLLGLSEDRSERRDDRDRPGVPALCRPDGHSSVAVGGDGATDTNDSRGMIHIIAGDPSGLAKPDPGIDQAPEETACVRVVFRKREHS
ncbi:hypothetical protein M3D15_03490 [Pseudoclavibacter alba]|uniref:Uncharacterized protein n=1 Tax=Pseudoclavibacter albus TaxID=272241 RepID=A0ABT2HVR8_9MICO|nr:hypothetical protein [Pseudoclavibacter alba]MCT2042401.1 hypothetical protein [Pseudoclavibacter alba]